MKRLRKKIKKQQDVKNENIPRCDPHIPILYAVINRQILESPKILNTAMEQKFNHAKISCVQKTYLKKEQIEDRNGDHTNRNCFNSLDYSKIFIFNDARNRFAAAL